MEVSTVVYRTLDRAALKRISCCGWMMMMQQQLVRVWGELLMCEPHEADQLRLQDQYRCCLLGTPQGVRWPLPFLMHTTHVVCCGVRFLVLVHCRFTALAVCLFVCLSAPGVNRCQLPSVGSSEPGTAPFGCVSSGTRMHCVSAAVAASVPDTHNATCVGSVRISLHTQHTRTLACRPSRHGSVAPAGQGSSVCMHA